MSKSIHVMVGVIWGDAKNILLAKRPDHLHQGGLWEFPGGKLEAGEEPITGLARELAEELGITVEQAEPLMEIKHNYPDKSVKLDIWQVSQFSNEPQGREGQAIRWVPVSDLNDYPFPAANTAIVEKLQAEFS